MSTPKYYAAIPIHVGLSVDIDKDDLNFQPGKDPIETRHHISVHVLLPNKPTPELQAKLHKIKSFDVELDTLGCFENKDQDVLFIKVNVSDQLLGLHKLLVEEYKMPWPHPEYKPHVTLAFLKPGRAKKYVTKLEKPIKALAECLRFEQHASKEKSSSDGMLVVFS
jgi:2'-5' RNA ligase